MITVEIKRGTGAKILLECDESGGPIVVKMPTGTGAREFEIEAPTYLGRLNAGQAASEIIMRAHHVAGFDRLAVPAAGSGVQRADASPPEMPVDGPPFPMVNG
ncbi:MAG: hypothetical protein KIPDCIKN_04369 [Haliscomenobacter sp.]|nr:hypothetical protein [Haliscomenobacter sp.]